MTQIEELEKRRDDARREGWELEAKIKQDINQAEDRIREWYSEQEAAIWDKQRKADAAYQAEEHKQIQIEAGYKPGMKMHRPQGKGDYGQVMREMYGVIEVVTEDSVLGGSRVRGADRWDGLEVGSMIIRHIKVDGHPGKMYDKPHYSSGLFQGWRQAVEVNYPKPKKKRKRAKYGKDATVKLSSDTGGLGMVQ